MDRLDVSFSVDATTQFQSRSRDVRPTGRGPCRRKIMHTLVVVRVRPSTDISPPPHQQPISSIFPHLQDQTPFSVVATTQL